MKVDKIPRLGNHTGGASKTVFAPIQRKLALTSRMTLHAGFPRLLFVPETMVLSSAWEGVWRGVSPPKIPPPPHPGSVSQAKSPLDKLSSRASRKPVYILSYWHRSSHQPPRAGTPPSPLFLHHRAMSTMLQVRGWSPPLAM